MLKDGYYISAYVHVDGLSNAANWWNRHDQNISLWKLDGDDVTLVEYWELERFTGQKQHFTAFSSIKDLDALLEPLLNKLGINLTDIIDYFCSPGIGSWHYKNDYISTVPYHTLCHLFSGLLIDTNVFKKNKIFSLVLDGGPDYVVDHDRLYSNEYLACYYDCGELKVTIPLTTSPGRLWYNAKERFGLREGSLMALQTATDVHADITISNTLLSDDKNDYYSAIAFLTQAWDGIFNESIKLIIPNDLPIEFTPTELKISACIKLLSIISVRIVERIIDKLIVLSDVNPKEVILSITGGFALNCPINTFLMNKYRFKGFQSPPCVNDAGISMGGALLEFYKNNANVNFILKNAYQGSQISEIDVINHHKRCNHIGSISNIDYNQVASDLCEGPIVWVSGKSEIGPRALGHRSLLIDPRYQKSKDQLNKIKQREWWRPVAPIVLEEFMSDWFVDGFPSPYMLHAFHIHPDKKENVKAIAHLDGTARIQSLSQVQNKELYYVIKAFFKKTGIPMIGNTSLNDKGEPIIESFSQALDFALRKKIKILYCNSKRYELIDFHKYLCPDISPREYKFLLERKKDPLYDELKRRGLTEGDISLLCRFPNFICLFDLKSDKGVAGFLDFAKYAFNNRRSFLPGSAHNEYLEIYNKWTAARMDENENIF